MTEGFTLFRHFYNMQILEDSFVYSFDLLDLTSVKGIPPSFRYLNNLIYPRVIIKKKELSCQVNPFFTYAN